jgi:hypothetical protein
MRIARHLLILPLLAAFAATASADIKKNATAGVQVDIPHDWKLSGAGDVLIAADPKEEAAVIFVATAGEDMKKVGEAVDKQLSTVAKDVKWGPQNKVTLGGMSGVAMKGSATMDGKAVNTGAIILVTPKKKGVFLIGFVQSDKEAAHKKELDAIAASLAAIK